MKKTILSLLICAAVTCSAHAETLPQSELAQEGIAYAAIIVTLKPATPLADNSSPTPEPRRFTLSDPTLELTPMFQANNSSELNALNARYGLDRYLRVMLPESKSKDKNYINNIIAELEHNQNVESVYPESIPVSLDETQQPTTQPQPKLKSTVSSNASTVSIPNFRYLQDYLKSPGEKRPGYYMGGVNRDSVNQYKGSEGEDITIVSSENCAWNDKHLNLPAIAFIQGPNEVTCKEREHNTASVGILAARDIGTGVRGLSWKSRVAYAAWPSTHLYNMIPLLKAGDVVSLNMQTYGGEVAGTCKSACYIPIENDVGYFNVIKALTDKGVFVITSAGNGNINLDSPAFNGKWDTQFRDSGAIIAGAFCAKDGKRANFSTYGKRVTSSSWGCGDVATTGYGNLHNITNANYTGAFGGTSSSTPIVAGVVASLSGIAKAYGITVTPLQMRQILQETGTPAASGTAAVIGTQPDMERAVARILALKDGGKTAPAPTAAAGADYTMVSPASGVSTYPLDGSKSLNVKSFNWSVTKGAGTFWLQEKLNGSLVNSVNSAHAWAVIPANTEGEVTYTLTTTGEDGRTAQDSMTIKVSKPAAPALDVPAYNAKIAYPTKCTKVSYNGKIWMNQWYVNPGQETPGTGGTWGVWRQPGATGNSCK